MTTFSFKLGRQLIYIKNSWNLEGLIQYQKNSFDNKIDLFIKDVFIIKRIWEIK